MDAVAREVLSGFALVPCEAAPGFVRGRNALLHARTRDDRAVIVKLGATVGREADVLSLLRSIPQLCGLLPLPLDRRSDPEALVLERLQGSTLHDRFMQGVDSETVRAIGERLSLLHRLTQDLPGRPARVRPHSLLTRRFCRPSPLDYANSSQATCQLLGAVQAFPGALEGLSALESEWIPACLVHGDVRAANLMQESRGGIVFIDWEMGSWGDPAQDVGSVIGELLLAAQRAGRSLETCAPALESLRSSYGADPELWLRALRWSGEALLRAASTIAQEERRFDARVKHLTRWAVELLSRPREEPWTR